MSSTKCIYCKCKYAGFFRERFEKISQVEALCVSSCGHNLLVVLDKYESETAKELARLHSSLLGEGYVVSITPVYRSGDSLEDVLTSEEGWHVVKRIKGQLVPAKTYPPVDEEPNPFRFQSKEKYSSKGFSSHPNQKNQRKR